MWLGYWFIAIFAFCASNFSQAQTSWPETNTSATTTLIRGGWIFGSLTDDQTILSGFIDLHAHYSLDFFYEGRVDEAYYNSLVYLANGVTSTWSAGEMNPQRIIDQRQNSGRRGHRPEIIVIWTILRRFSL
jgi:hypothetical protein